MSERDMLQRYGTQVIRLSPNSVLQAARADMRRKIRNAEIGKLAFGCDGYEQYAFHRKHVRKAIDAEELLVRALMEPGLGLGSDKYNTRLLYGDGGLLFAAIQLARGARDGEMVGLAQEAGNDRAAMPA